MKKLILCFAMLSVLAIAAFADHPGVWGVGFMGRGGWGYGSGALGGGALSLKAPQLPIYWGINADIGKNYFGFGITGDKYFIDSFLLNLDIATLGWYLGVGGFLGFGTYDNNSASWTNISFGARLPIGLSLQIPVSTISVEIFGALVPNLGFGFWFWDSKHDDYWKDENRDHIGVVGGIGGELGLRVWF